MTRVRVAITGIGTICAIGRDTAAFTDALRRGDHEAHQGLMTAHAVIGVTIPIVMAGAGWAATADLSFLSGSGR